MKNSAARESGINSTFRKSVKRLLGTGALLAVSCLIPQAKVSAQSALPPVPIQVVCRVNGVDYPVDFSSEIWGHDVYYNWAIIGRIVATPYGYRAIRLDGVNFPAACPAA